MTDNEATQFAPAAENTAKTTEKKAGKWRSRLHDAASTGIGVLVGAATPVMMGMKSSSDETASGEHKPTPNHSEVLSHPELVDTEVPVATGVSDDMSFGQAFAAARAETGPGGVFEWHGNLYGTYTAEEWDAMSAGERADFGRHFAWSRMDHSQSDVASHDSQSSHNSHGSDDSDIEVVSVNHQHSGNDSGNTVHAARQEPADSSDSEIEVLGIVHNDELDANIAAVNIDGNEVYLIDVDNDRTFDLMMNDANANGSIDDGELADISGAGLTIDDLGGMMDPTPDMSYDA